MGDKCSAWVCTHQAWSEGPPATARTSASTLLSSATMMSFLQHQHCPDQGRTSYGHIICVWLAVS